jgi:uncharacterized protein (TIGR02996 family)
MTTEAAFLDAMLDEDDVDTSRLIFADWLDEHGQPERGEFLRVQCELASWIPDLDRREELKRREEQLRREYGLAWLGPLAKHCVSWRFVRGLAHVTIDASVYFNTVAPSAPEWLRAAWVQRLRLENLAAHHLELFELGLQHVIGELDLSRSRVRIGVVAALLGRPQSLLRSVDLSNAGIRISLTEQLLRHENLSSLRQLNLRNNVLHVTPSRISTMRNALRSSRDIDVYGTGLWDSRLHDWGNGPMPKRVGRVCHNSIGMRLAFIPAGTFFMGAPEHEDGRFANELPRHRVTLSKPFFLGVFPVTQREYQRVIGSNPSRFQEEELSGGFLPVEQVTWKKAVEFCKRLSALPEEKAAGRRYRLPTEAEWEYACRVGTTTPFSCGMTLSNRDANFAAESPYGDAPVGTRIGRTTAVGSYPPNAFGLYDMHGNVWEWVRDFYNEKYYHESPAIDPAGPAKGRTHVLRGGSWFIVGRGCRSAERCYTNEAPVQEAGSVGFRVVMDVPES